MFMRIFLSILLLIISFQSWAKANDIKDFELEGLSLGDSLLNFFNKKQITTEMNSGYAHFYKDNKFVKLAIGTSNEYSMRTNLNIYDDNQYLHIYLLKKIFFYLKYYNYHI